MRLTVFRMQIKLEAHKHMSIGSTLNSSPALKGVLNRLASEEHQRLVDEIRRGSRVISISGLISEPSRALVLASLQRTTGKSFAIVAQSNQDLENWERDLRFWYCAINGAAASGENVLLLPASESDPYAGSS